MKKKVALYISIFILVPVIIFGGLYIGLAFYYSDGFCYGTWVNGVYCTGKSVVEINEELLSEVCVENLSVIDKNGDVFLIEPSKIDYTLNYTQTLSDLKEKQNPLLWGHYFINPNVYDLNPQITYNEQKLQALLENEFYPTQEMYNESNIIEIEETEQGYILRDQTKDLLVANRTIAVIDQALSDKAAQVDLAESGCYESLHESNKDKETLKLWSQIDSFQSFTLTYLIGDVTEVIDPGVTSKWILKDESGEFVFDESGQLVLDEEKVKAYAVSLSEKYDTLGKERTFLSTRGDTITLDGGTYGNDIDEEAEAALLIEAFLNKDSGKSREPIYKVKAWSQGSDDIGGTYIEVDMTTQMLYYYVDHNIALQTSVVTGNMKRGCATPAKMCYIYSMQRNRTLRGANYATFVYYWIAVYGNIGLHDATWRKEFGGDIYKTEGSHGCINMPKDKASELYGMVKKGTPVILFY